MSSQKPGRKSAHTYFTYSKIAIEKNSETASKIDKPAIIIKNRTQKPQKQMAPKNIPQVTTKNKRVIASTSNDVSVNPNQQSNLESTELAVPPNISESASGNTYQVPNTARITLNTNSQEPKLASNNFRIQRNNPGNWLAHVASKRKQADVENNIKKMKPSAANGKSDNRDDEVYDPENPLEKSSNIIVKAGYKITCRRSKDIFTYVGHKFDDKNNEKGIVALCSLCSKQYVYSSSAAGGSSNLVRHLKRAHPEEFFKEEEKDKKQKDQEQSSITKWLEDSGKKYSESDVPQKNFKNALLYCIAKDKLPLNIGGGTGFRNLVATLDSKVNIPSRSTLERCLKSRVHKTVIPGLKNELSKVDHGIISLDGWKSRRKDGIIGIKFHFIDENWSLQKRTIGIKELNVSQTGAAIRDCLYEVLDELELRKKVSFVITDSGKNMLKAFRPPKPDPKPAVNLEYQDLSSEEESEQEGHSDLVTDEILLFCESDDDSMDLSEIDIDQPTAVSDVVNFLDGNMRPLQCSSHLLQLAINHGFEDETTAIFLAYINSVINFFNNHLVYLADLRKRTGKGLLRKAETRWNYWIDALRRLAEEPVFNAVQELLEKAHSTFKTAQKRTLPRKITKHDFRKIQELIAILAPFGQVTDQLQSDGITSSILIPSIVSNYKALTALQVKCFDGLKNRILEQIKARFEPILRKPEYILATALDPRMKLNVFKLQDTAGLMLPSVREAKQICEDHLDLIKDFNHHPRRHHTSSPASSSNFIDNINFEVATTSSTDDTENEPNEFDQYLAEVNVSSESDILRYWKENMHRFPKLACSAKLHLAIPASSASVERLFSELSAIGRAHRASIQSKRLEELIMYAEFFGKQYSKKEKINYF